MACPAVSLNSLENSDAAESRCSFSRWKSAAATRVDHRYCTTASQASIPASAQQIMRSVRELNVLFIHLHSRPKCRAPTMGERPKALPYGLDSEGECVTEPRP